MKRGGRENLRSEMVVPSLKSGRMVEAVLTAAAENGLTLAKDGRIAGRMSRELIDKAKTATGITSDTELLEFALATIALEAKFPDAFHEVRGRVDPEIDFGL
ncbi:MAG: hypothetical protein VYD57_19005 [Pseudomonadota bacterium]|nr:hypothetical protein [Pseudomonadota bacterium]